MNKKYVLISLLIIAVFGALYLFYKTESKNSTKTNTMDQKTYALSSVTLNSENLEFKHKNTPPGSTHMLFIVQVGEAKYVITKFSWPVIPNPVAVQEEGSTFVLENGKATPLNKKFTYDVHSKVLEGSLEDGNAIKIENADSVTILDSSEFEQVKVNPGLEKATYIEE